MDNKEQTLESMHRWEAEIVDLKQMLQDAKTDNERVELRVRLDRMEACVNGCKGTLDRIEKNDLRMAALRKVAEADPLEYAENGLFRVLKENKDQKFDCTYSDRRDNYPGLCLGTGYTTMCVTECEGIVGCAASRGGSVYDLKLKATRDLQAKIAPHLERGYVLIF